MTDFVIVIAAAAGLIASGGGTAPNPVETTVKAPLEAPAASTFRTYPDEVSCEQAVAGMAAPAGRRAVCLPIESTALETGRPY